MTDRRIWVPACAAITMLFWAGTAIAVLPGEQLADPALEARARAISADIRCVVCQNQSIDDSDAPLAHDLRVIVREQISAGKTDAQAKDYLVARYGSYVLLKPPFEAATWALWLGPAAFVLLGGAGAWAWVSRRARPAGTAALSAEETARIDALLNK